MTARKLDWHGGRLFVTELMTSLMIDSGGWALDFSRPYCGRRKKRGKENFVTLMLKPVRSPPGATAVYWSSTKVDSIVRGPSALLK